MSVAGFSVPVIVDLAGLKASRDKIPILLDHDPSRIVGQTDGIAIDSSGVRLTGSITGEDAAASSVVSHARNGFEWQASIGASIVRQEFVKSGEKAVVNAREVSGPILIARESRLFETSFVAIGADQQTSASVAASNPQGSTLEREPTMFEQWLKAKGFDDPAALTDQQKATLKAAFDAEQAADKTVAASGTPVTFTAGVGGGSPTRSLDAIFADAQRERERIDEITNLTADAIQKYPGRLDEIKALSQAAIEAKSPINEFKYNLLELQLRFPNFRVDVRNRIAPRVIEAALCRSGGLRDAEKHFDEQTLEASDRQFRHGVGLRELLLMGARERGYRSDSKHDVRGLLEAAFGTIRADGFSTISVPGILSNVANKFLAQSFMAVESGWQSIASRRNVSDFKAITSYSLTGSGQYEKVGAGGEIKHGELGELSYTNQADTYGKMFGITRKDIINDDLGAFTQIPIKLGRGGALKLNDVFWTAFLAGIAANFWSSGNANVSTGGGSALSSAGLATALQKFRKQTDPDSKPLGITPRILLVPPELEITADELMTSTAINTGGSSSTDKVPNRNVWTSKFQTVMSSYLSNSSYTGYSTTAWWLLADPQDLSTIEVAFLNGREMPVIETAEAEFDTLGIMVRAYHDFGVALQEYRASVRSAGT